MQLYTRVPRRDHEGGLRAVGALLDEQELEDALVLELAEGFLTMGRRRRGAFDRAATPSREHAETLVRDQQLDAAARRSRRRRGSGRQAGPYEGALRLIGRRVDAEGGSLILLVDQGDGFLLRMLTTDVQGWPYRTMTIGTAELDVMRADAIGARAR